MKIYKFIIQSIKIEKLFFRIILNMWGIVFDDDHGKVYIRGDSNLVEM